MNTYATFTRPNPADYSEALDEIMAEGWQVKFNYSTAQGSCFARATRQGSAIIEVGYFPDHDFFGASEVSETKSVLAAIGHLRKLILPFEAELSEMVRDSLVKEYGAGSPRLAVELIRQYGLLNKPLADELFD
jgi:hypothetical protein